MKPTIRFDRTSTGGRPPRGRNDWWFELWPGCALLHRGFWRDGVRRAVAYAHEIGASVIHARALR